MLEITGTLDTATGEELGVAIAEGLSVSGQMVVLTSVVTTAIELGEGVADADSSGHQVVVTSSVITLVEESVAEARAARAREAAKKCIICLNECQIWTEKNE